MNIPQKLCTKCGNEYPSTTKYFYKRNNGLTAECKQCLRKRSLCYYHENSDLIHERRRPYFEARKEQSRLYAKEYYATHKESINEKNRSYYKKHKNRINAWNRQYRQNNKERNRVKRRVESANRRARIKEAGGTFTDKDIRNLYKAQKGRCYWCNKKVRYTYHIDHVIPLARGGSNGTENIVIACPECNDSKGAKLPHEWDGNNGKMI